MVLRLDPDHPMVWRTPHLLQFGIEAPISTVPSHSTERGGLERPRELMLDVLARGVGRPLLTHLAAENGLSGSALDELLGELSAVLIDESTRAAPLEGLVVAVDGGGAGGGDADGAGDAHARTCPAATELAALVWRMGGRLWPRPARESGSTAAPDLAVVVSHYVTEPRRTAMWLRDDVPHLLVEFGDRSIRVGPVVGPALAPGSRREPGPCALCIEHARTDADPGWPTIAVQALRRTAPSADALGSVTAAALGGRVLAEYVAGQNSWHDHAFRVLRPGQPGQAVVRERIRPHPSCGCHSLPGTATADAPPNGVIRPPPRRARGVPGRG